MSNTRRSFLSSAIAVASAVAIAGPTALLASEPQPRLGVHRWKLGADGQYEWAEFVRMYELKPGDTFFKFDDTTNTFSKNFLVRSMPYQNANGIWTVEASTI